MLSELTDDAESLEVIDIFVAAEIVEARMNGSSGDEAVRAPLRLTLDLKAKPGLDSPIGYQGAVWCYR